ncbi:MAG: cupin domain-containing protein [Patescibacteria group bacterium]|nr:cupin domain-containing protein [Patescibacteria group bacterium]
MADRKLEIVQMALENEDFRRVIAAGGHAQVVLMALKPGEDIGMEVHKGTDQVLFFVQGTGNATIGGQTFDIKSDDLFFVPDGTMHNFANTGEIELKLFTLYSPPAHPEGTVHHTKAEAEAAEKY